METRSLQRAHISAILREARQKRGLTQMEVSRRLGRPPSFVSKYESGERSLDVLEFNRIARELRIDAATALRRIDARSSTRRLATKRRTRPVVAPVAKRPSRKVKVDENMVDAIEKPPTEAASMKLRAELARQIVEIMHARQLTQAKAAELIGVTKPRISDLMRIRLNRFSTDTLANMADRLGLRTHLVVVPR